MCLLPPDPKNTADGFGQPWNLAQPLSNTHFCTRNTVWLLQHHEQSVQAPSCPGVFVARGEETVQLEIGLEPGQGAFWPQQHPSTVPHVGLTKGREMPLLTSLLPGPWTTSLFMYDCRTNSIYCYSPA